MPEAGVGERGVTSEAPSRGELGDAGRRRVTDDACASYELEIRRSIRTFLECFVLEEKDRGDLFFLKQNPFGGTASIGFYRKALDSLCSGELRVISVLAPEGVQSSGSYLSFPISLKDVGSFSPSLLKWFLNFPADVLVLADDEIRSLIASEIVPKLCGNVLPFNGLRVSLFDHPKSVPIRDLNPSQLETLIQVSGTIIRVSSVIPEMQFAVFQCTNITTRHLNTEQCNHIISAVVTNGYIEEPLFCPACQARQSFTLVHDRCVYSSKQLLKLQENPEAIPEGESPQTLFVFVFDDLVDCARPGDRVRVTGIYKAVPVRKTPRTRVLKSIFRTCIDTVHIAKEKGASVEGPSMLTLKDTERIWTASFIAKAHSLAADPEVAYNTLVEAFAPEVWEHVDVKKGLLCQLFAGGLDGIGGGRNIPGQRSDVRAFGSKRGEVHILLCGDPSTAKSQLLGYVHKLSDRGVYIVGRGVSVAGMTASIVTDNEGRGGSGRGESVLECGALLLSDGGICCIDEFDKMDENVRMVLTEVMEQQMISLAKAGIVCNLKTRVSILASSNPKKSRFNKKKSILDNLNLSNTLLSRFDLIFLILDQQDSNLDRKLATHLTSLYSVRATEHTRTEPTRTTAGPETTGGPTAAGVPTAGDGGPAGGTGSSARVRKCEIDRAFLKQYISYARSTCHPSLTSEAEEELVQTYLSFRAAGGQNISATPRQLDSLIRLSISLARMHLSPLVKVPHVREAARLMRAATYQALIDPFTGQIDFEQLHSGLSAQARSRSALIGNQIMTFLKGGDADGADNGSDGISYTKEMIEESIIAFLQEQQAQTLQPREIDRELKHLVTLKQISRTFDGKYFALTPD